MHPQEQRTRVLALSALLAAVGILTALLAGSGDSFAVGERGSLHWWSLVPLFALADVLAVPLRRRGGRPVVLPLTAAPLVLGLFLASPVDLLVGRVLAATLVGVIWRDRPALRLSLDAALVAGGTAAAQAVFSAVAGPGTLAWLDVDAAAVVAAATTGLLDASVVVLVADWYEGRTPGGEVARLIGGSLAGAALAGGAAVAGRHLAPAGGLHPAVLASAVVLVVHRLVLALADHRRNLVRLHELSDALVDAPASADVVGLMLEKSLSLIGAKYAEATLVPEALGLPDGGQSRCWVLRAGAGPGGGPVQGTPGSEVASLGVPAEGHVVVTRATDAGREFLAARQLTEAVVVPLRDEDEVIGHLVVGDRIVRSTSTVEAEARLLETVANHASVALRNTRLIRRLAVEARQDELTGLPNRLELRELLDAAALAASGTGPPCAVMVLDFNGFKAINDTLGHQAGDELLRVLAGRLAQAAADDATVARLGGDEFAVLSTRCASPDAATALGGRLLEVFVEPVLVAGARLRLGGSLGVALGPEHGGNGSDLLRNADIAMYAAKAAGGGQRMFSADLVELTASGLTLATDLKDAVERGDITVVVQPMVDLATGELHSVEVLARWHHPELGEVPPEQFFLAAERSGLVTALSACVLDKALALSRRWADDGLRVRVAVNLASRWLAEPTLPEQVGTALARHGVAADMLCLELTERSVVADPRRVTETLARLAAMGVHLSVDDFGTGYSSLTYLSRLPVDQMKIDKSFVAELDASPRDQAIVRSMIDLGRNLGLEVVAEGIMTAEVLAALVALGCGLGQGYLIAHPLDPAELPAFLDGHARSGSAGLPRQGRRVEAAP